MSRASLDMTKAQSLRDWQAKVAIILGSGLNSLVGDLKNEQIISYGEFAGVPEPTAPGHAGRFVLSEIGSTRVILAEGRVHLYEGFSARDVTAGIRVLAEAGIEKVILTNAAGAANSKFKPGEWMLITDQINLTGTSPLAAQFVDLTDAFSRRWREKFRESAHRIGMVLHEGVYAGMRGPQYETPAEVRMLQRLGADAIGMSTVLEVIQARALGLEVAGFSCLTNLAAGLSGKRLTHEEVIVVGAAAAADFGRLLKTALSAKSE